MYLGHKLVCVTRLRVVTRGQYHDLKIIVLGLFGDDTAVEYGLITLHRDNPAQEAKIGGRIRLHEFSDLPRVHTGGGHGGGHLNAAGGRRIEETTLGHGDLTLRRESTDLRRTVVRLATRL
jgi:hypothetical protein